MAAPSRYVLCIKNRGHLAALEVRKVYRVLDDAAAQRRGLMRIVDESGEDYLYPSAFFLPVELPREVARMFKRKSA